MCITCKREERAKNLELIERYRESLCVYQNLNRVFPGKYAADCERVSAKQVSQWGAK